MLPETKIVPDDHHVALLTKKPGEKELFNSKEEVEAATTNESWVAITETQPDKNGVLIEAVSPTGYTPEEWIEPPRMKNIFGLIAEQVMPEIPSE